MNIENFCEMLSEGLDMGNVTPDTQISELDSMQVIIMIALVHDKFDQQLEASDIEKASNIKDIYALISTS